MIFPTKKSDKKARTLYLAASVAFFFTLFSFGKIADAAVLYSNTSGTSFGTGGSSDNFQVTATGTAATASYYAYTASGGTTAIFRINGAGGCDTATSTLAGLGATTAGFPDPLGNGQTAFTASFTGNCLLVPGVNYSIAADAGSQGSVAWYNPYMVVESSGPPPLPTASSLELDTPTAVTYLQNPVVFSGTYTNVHTFNQVQFDLVSSSFTGSLNFQPLNLPFTTAVDSVWTTSRNLPFQGNYTVRARLFDTSNGSSTPWTSPVSFGLGTTTVSTSTQETLPGSPQPIDCDALDIACHLKNAMVWLLWPSQDSVDAFQSLTLETTWPFSYAYEIGTIREELFTATETGTSTIGVTVPGFGTITFLSKDMMENVPYSGLVKTILGWILWFMFAEYVYYRVVRAHDNNTPA